MFRLKFAYQALLQFDFGFQVEIDALALSLDVAGRAVDLPADAVLAVLTQGAALLVEGAEAVRRVIGVPATFHMINFLIRLKRGPQVAVMLQAMPCTELISSN